MRETKIQSPTASKVFLLRLIARYCALIARYCAYIAEPFINQKTFWIEPLLRLTRLRRPLGAIRNEDDYQKSEIIGSI